MSVYSIYRTDKELEKKGVIVDLGGIWFRCARPGGSNEHFHKTREAVTKVHSYRIQNNLLSTEEQNAIFAEIYSKAVVLGWGSDKFGDGLIEDWSEDAPEDAPGQPFSPEGCKALFLAVPEIFNSVVKMLDTPELFRKQQIEADIKN